MFIMKTDSILREVGTDSLFVILEDGKVMDRHTDSQYRVIRT
jgi:hypothetical protein